MFAFLALTLQMGHTVQDSLEDYWTKMEQLCSPFYGQMMARARYCHILRFLHLRTIIGLEMTGQMVNCGKYEGDLKRNAHVGNTA